MSTKVKPAIWLSGFDLNQDIALFAPDTPAPITVSQIAVFQISTQMVLNSSDQQLSQLFSELKARGIALCVAGLMLPGPYGTPGPGWGVEGFSAPGTMGLVAQKIAQCGGILDYVAMDEPLYYGHEYEGPYAAQESIAAVAQQVASSIADIRAVFPNVQVGDGEPIPNTPLQDITQWMADLQAATGKPLAFFDADYNWNSINGESSLDAVAQAVQSAGVKFGVFYDGDGSDQTGAAWVNHAESRIATVAADPSLSPDIAYISSWDAQPTNLGPETDLSALTHLIPQFNTITGLFSTNAVTSAGALALNATAPASNVAVIGFNDQVSGLSISANSVAANTTFLVTLTATNGTLTVTQEGAAKVSGNGSKNVSIQGDLTDINAELATLAYTGGAAGNDAILVSILDDLGGNAQVAIPVSAENLLSVPLNPNLSLSDIFRNVYGQAPTAAELADLQAIAAQKSLQAAEQPLIAAAQTEIGRLYLEVQGRGPDSGGLTGFTTALLNGTSLNSIRHTFAFSGEAQNHLTTAYNGVYGTAPTATQVTAAETALANGSTLQQVEAPWFTQAEAEATQLYQSVQGRDPVPSEISSTANALMSGKSLSALRSAFATSNESQQRLTNLCENLLGYAPSQTVLASLENQLASGTTIQTLTTALEQQAASTVPTLGGTVGSQNVSVGSTSLPFSAVTVSDTDPNEIETVTVSIASGGGTLTTSGAGTLSQNSTVWTVTGNASYVQAALRSLTFVSPAGSGGSTTLSLSVTNGAAHAASALTTITEIGSQTAPTLGGTAPASHVAILGFTDPIGGLSISANASAANATFTAILSAGNGTISATQVGTASVSGSGTNSLTLRGDLADVNAELATLAYTGARSSNSDTVQISFSDGRGDNIQLAIPVVVESRVSASPSSALSLSTVFSNVFSRAPTAAELANLNAATQSVAALEQADQELAAAAQSQVASLYLDVYGRNPDLNGLTGFTTALMNGESLNSIRHTFAFSAEEQKDLANAYQGVYGAPLTSSALLAAENALASGSTQQQIEAPWRSYAQTEVSQLYWAVDGRAPDPGGLSGCIGALLSGTSLNSIRRTMAFSPEAQSHLTTAYESALGYAPSQAVLANLEIDIASGTTLQALTTALQQQAASTVPSVGGIASSQTLAAGNTSLPFATVTVADSDPNEIETATVSISSGGGTLTTSGAGKLSQNLTGWTVTGSASYVQAALRSLTFVPPPNSNASLSLSVTDGAAHSANATVAITVENVVSAQTTPNLISTLAGQSTAVAIVGNTASVTTKGTKTQASFSGRVMINSNGTDTISIDQTSSLNVTISGSANRLTVTDAGRGNLTFIGGSGNVTLTGGSGTNSVALGSCAGGNIFFDGNMTVTGGSGPFNWEFRKGDVGTDVIPYKIGHDTIVLNGYGTDRSAAITSNTSSGGNTMLVLSDNTHITLTGVAHISNNSIVLQ